MAWPIRHVTIRNYKSIGQCSVDLGAIRFLVGPNGSGKSNFLDAMRFVSDALNTTLEQALRDRGGIGAVRRKSRGHPTHFGVQFGIALPAGREASYAFKVGSKPEGALVVQREECHVRGLMRPESFFIVEAGKIVDASCEIRSALESDRLALVALSGLPEFRPVYDVLRRMRFYNLNLSLMRDLQDSDPGQVLQRDGRNLAAVVRELGRSDGGKPLADVCEYLRAIVPDLVAIEHKPIGPKETIEFVQGDGNPRRFLAWNMSDGTLRALGILVAAFQGEVRGERPITLIGIEEPELALHPGAAEVVAEVLLLASERVQVLVTTHSPEILDHKGIHEDHLLAVTMAEGETVVGALDPASRSALKDRLYLAGELLAQGQIEPEIPQATDPASQRGLFGDGED